MIKPPAIHPIVAPTRTSGNVRSPCRRWVIEIVANKPQAGPPANEETPRNPKNQSGCQPASKTRKAANNPKDATTVDHTNKRFAGTRWSANAPPINGDTNAHTGETIKAHGTHSRRPIEPKILVSADIHMPGPMPCKKNTNQIAAKTHFGFVTAFRSSSTRQTTRIGPRSHLQPYLKGRDLSPQRSVG